ncbi:MAG: hypothetical protein E6Q97_09980 [Desulfurellales bacterium]|nr:MAG: hypothetical protein E6Q97_09980 [Desulfurellales bacterium]
MSHPAYNSGRPFPDRFPDVDLADPDLPLRIEFQQMCPSRDECNPKQVNIDVGALKVYLRTKLENKRREMLLLTITDGSIRRDHQSQLPYFHVHDSVKQRVTISREIREAIIRHIVANPLVGKYCRDKNGKGARDQWQTSRPSIALMDSMLRNSSPPPNGS